MRGLLFAILLLCAAAACQAEDKQSQRGGMLRPPSGIFQSEARFHPGGTSTNGVPLFTLNLDTNGTYRTECSMPDYVQGIDGGGLFSYRGTESGTWQWDPQNRQIVLKVTQSSHMSRCFPQILKLDEHNFRLEAINLPPRGPQPGGPLWLPLLPASFHRKIE